jgi:hypothetical protein
VAIKAAGANCGSERRLGGDSTRVLEFVVGLDGGTLEGQVLDDARESDLIGIVRTSGIMPETGAISRPSFAF